MLQSHLKRSSGTLTLACTFSGVSCEAQHDKYLNQMGGYQRLSFFLGHGMFHVYWESNLLTLLGSIVQKGKFSAGMAILVSVLNSVLFPTLGSPTMPT